MSNIDLVRAWKDPQYRGTLRPDDLAGLPANPAGSIDLDGLSVSDQIAGAGTLHTDQETCTSEGCSTIEWPCQTQDNPFTLICCVSHTHAHDCTYSWPFC